jgi:integrase
MAQTTREAKIDTITARAKLAVRAAPYYRSLGDGIFYIGYRKATTGGRWLIRIYNGNRTYSVESFARADDIGLEADGINVLSFQQAIEYVKNHKNKKIGAGKLTVGNVLDAYLTKIESEHRSTKTSRNCTETHIRPKFGDVPVDELTSAQIREWLSDLAESGKHVRRKAGTPSRKSAKPETDDKKRQRRASANRTLSVLRAALNSAFQDETLKIESDAAWRRVKPFKGVDVPKIRYFTMDEVIRLVNATHGAFRNLVNGALFTGCRYGELCKLKMRDFNVTAGTVFVAKSKSGKKRDVALTEEGIAFFQQITAGRDSDELMFTKDDGSTWGTSHQIRPMLQACEDAGIVPPAGFHALRHTAASHNVMGGVPIKVVAENLGHTTTKMTETHYAHLSKSYVADQIQKHGAKFGTSK